MNERIYLDHNATTSLRPAAADAVARALSMTGNPSSVHVEGRAARGLIEDARERVAALVGARPGNVVFTSGGTEAANTVLSPALRYGRDERSPTMCLALATEHVCVLDGARFPRHLMELIPVDASGVADLGWLCRRVSRQRGALVSVHTANNETGVIQPIAEAAALVHDSGGLLHTDAVQAVGRIAFDVGALGVDVLTLSAHKLGGPRGVGAIVLNDDIHLDRLIRGGGQERNSRAGTENLSGIAGFGAAAELALAECERTAARLGVLRDQLEAEVRRIAPDAVTFGEAAARLPNTSAFAVPGIRAETLVMWLDLAGIAVSSGSACSSGKVRRSHVLEAMGVPSALAEGVIRISLGWNSTEKDVAGFVTAFEKGVEALHERRGGRQAA